MVTKSIEKCFQSEKSTNESNKTKSEYFSLLFFLVFTAVMATLISAQVRSAFFQELTFFLSRCALLARKATQLRLSSSFHFCARRSTFRAVSTFSNSSQNPNLGWFTESSRLRPDYFSLWLTHFSNWSKTTATWTSCLFQPRSLFLALFAYFSRCLTGARARIISRQRKKIKKTLQRFSSLFE